MAVTPVSANPLQEIANLLLKNFDTNKDGKLGADEFSSLMTQLASTLNVPAAAVTTPTPYKTTSATTPIVGLAATGGRFEGFDLTRAQDPQKSAKDAFAMLASRSGTMPRTKAEAEQWFNTHIRAEMEALGHKINWVKGDQFSFTNWQGTFTIDFVRGADGDNPAFAWQAMA